MKEFVKWFLHRRPLKNWFWEPKMWFYFKGNRKTFGLWQAICSTIPILQLHVYWQYRNHSLDFGSIELPEETKH